MKNTKKNKTRKLILGVAMPALLLVSGTAAITSAIVINNNNATLVNVKDLFSQAFADTDWRTDVSVGAEPAMTTESCLGGTAFSGEGFRDPIKRNFVWNKENLLYYLQQIYNQATSSSTSHRSLVNELDVTFQANYDQSVGYNKWQKVTISAQSGSVNYTGSFDYYFYLDKSDVVRTLADDFKDNSITLNVLEGYEENYAPSYAEMLKGIKLTATNENLNINAVHVEYTTNRTTWTILPTTRSESVWGTNESLWLSLWNPEKASYGDITSEEKTFGLRLAPNTFSAYAGCDPIEFSISFARKNITEETGWQSTWNSTTAHEFIVNPDEGNFKTVMAQEYGETAFYSKLNTEKAGNCWSFTNVGSNGEFAITTSTNPYYSPISKDDAGVDATKLQFKYTILNKENFNTLYQSYFTGFDNFYQKPNVNDVISVVKANMAAQSKTDDIYWSEVTITITETSTAGGTITVSVVNSLHYTGTNFTVNYALL